MKRHVDITADRLREMISYDQETGVFHWKVRVSNVKAGSVAGRIIGKAGYRYIRIDGYEYTAQRLAWLYVTGKWPPGVIQFKDGDNGNITFGNLREGNSLKNASDFDTSTKEGMRAYNRARRAAFPEQHRNNDLKKNFGIGLVEYEVKLVAQNGLCACCGKPETAVWAKSGQTKRLAVDHNHATGEVRDLLCSLCNPMIGYAQEDVARLRAAIRYLEKHSKAEKVIPLRVVSKEKE